MAIERSIGSHVRVDVRVLAYLWHLADRFGVVKPGAVKLDLPLTHAVLARLVGARRPTVTTALQRLIQLGYVAREGRTFVLVGDASSVDDLDQRSPAKDFAYPDGETHEYRFETAQLN
jgi:CRP-like cAMP-binding protein